MKVLIACEYSGTVRDAFIKAGHDAMSCDLLPTDATGPHYQGDVTDILNDGWDILIAHPPCTYLSNAGARWLHAGKTLNIKRFEQGLDAKTFFLLLFNANIPRVAIENPIPSSVFELPKYSQTIQPYEFGHPFKKKTCLWLKNLPKLTPTDVISEKNRESTKIPGNWFNKGGKERQKERARTFQGIADAMAAQWGSL